MNKQIHQAIERTHAGLKPDALLADKIIAQERRRCEEQAKGHSGLTLPQKMKRMLALTMATLLITVTAIALMHPMMSMDAYGLWTYEDGKLMYQSTEAKRPRVILEDEGIVAMAADVNLTGTLYYITRSEEGQYLKSITTGGYSVTPGREIDSSFSITDMAASSNSVYAVVKNKEYRDCVYVMSPYPDQADLDTLLHIDGWNNKMISSITMDDNVLLAYREGTGELAAINYRQLELYCPTVKVSKLKAMAVGFERDGDQYALVIDGDTRLMLLNTRTGEMSHSGQRITEQASSLSRDDTSLYVYDFDGRQTGCFNIAELAGRRIDHQLTVVDGPFMTEPAMNIAIEMFNERYPDVEVVRREILDNRVLATEMMADEGGVDVFSMQGMYGMTPPAGLLASGAVLELTDVPEIQALRSDYRDIWSLVSTYGKQYGVIWGLGVELLQVNPKLAEAVGWEIPTGVWTMADFDELADKVYAYNQTAEKPIYLAGNNVMEHLRVLYEATHMDYYLGNADFQTEEYLQLMGRYQSLAAKGLIYMKNPKSLSLAMPPDTLLWAEEKSLGYMGNDVFVLPPVYDANEPVYLVDSWPLMVNANSRYPEEAAYFLACYASVEAESQKFYYSQGQLLKDKTLYAEQQLLSKVPSAQNEALYNFVLEHGVPMLRELDLMRLQITEGLIDRLLSGDISPQEYADAMQQKADMLVGE